MAKYKLEKAQCYHFNMADGALEIRFNQQNKIYLQKFYNGTLDKKQVVALCDEEVLLFNGETLKRNKAELSIN